MFQHRIEIFVGYMWLVKFQLCNSISSHDIVINDINMYWPTWL